MLEMVQPFGDFDWVLAKEVLTDETYAEYYRNSDRLKFVDNSVNEEGEPVSLEEMEEVFKLVNGNYIVSPDWIGDATRTIEAYGECVERFSREVVVGVVQGVTFKEAMACLNIYESGVLSIPYDICSSKEDPPWLMGLRRALLVSNIPSDRIIHLLGFTSLDEFYWYEGKPNVYSIDTGIPVLLGLQGMDILDPLGKKDKPTYNEMQKFELGQKEWTAICRNIALLRKWMP